MDEARIGEIPLFALLSRRERGRVARHLRPVVVPAGEHLVDEGESAYEFFVIEDGTAAVISSGKHLTDLGPGDFFGEIGVLHAGERTASVIATSELRVVVMRAEDFVEIERSMPSVAKQVSAAVEERLARDRLFGLERG